MSWEAEVEELRRRQALAEQMGGAEKVARQHARGKLDARARIAGIVDAGSFREIGKIAGKGRYGTDGELLDLAPANLIFGRAEVAGRPVVASADDFTVRGGAADAAIHRKFVQCEQMAHTLKIPLIRMIDGTGGGGSEPMMGTSERSPVAMPVTSETQQWPSSGMRTHHQVLLKFGLRPSIGVVWPSRKAYTAS